jgi:hypothetical protein
MMTTVASPTLSPTWLTMTLISIDAGSVTATRRRCAGSGTKLVGRLDHCLRHHERYREETGWTLTA